MVASTQVLVGIGYVMGIANQGAIAFMGHFHSSRQTLHRVCQYVDVD